MKKVVYVEGIGEMTFESENIRPHSIGDDEYNETAITECGALIAYDDASNMWVQLYPSRPSDY